MEKEIEQTMEKEIEQTVLTAGNVAVVTFKFKEKPEFLEPYGLFIFRSGNIHGVGTIVEPLSIEKDPNAKPDPVKSKRFKKVRKARAQKN